jgi:hypothetical protein
MTKIRTASEITHNKDLQDQLTILRAVVADTFWMARRYANQRQTYAPDMVNQALEKLERIGVEIADDDTLVQDGNSSPKYLDKP